MKQSAEFFFHLYTICLQSKMCKDRLPTLHKKRSSIVSSFRSIRCQILLFSSVKTGIFTDLYSSPASSKALLHPHAAPASKSSSVLSMSRKRTFYLMVHIVFPLDFFTFTITYILYVSKKKKSWRFTIF